MVRKCVIFALLMIICSCSNNKDNLTYHTINNEDLIQQIRNYVDSVNIGCEEKMLSVGIRFLEIESYTNNYISKSITQYDLDYKIFAYDLLWSHFLFAKIDTFVVAFQFYNIDKNIFLSDEIGWKYLKNTFKKDYIYYLDSLKTDSITSYPLFFDNNIKIPNWTLIFEDDKLIMKIVSDTTNKDNFFVINY